MMKRLATFLIIFILALLMGCSGGGTPVIPDASEIPQAQIASGQEVMNHALWGIWNFSFDPGTSEITVLPARGLLAHFNITDFVIPPSCNDCVKVKLNSFDPGTQLLDVDVTLKNPTKMIARDVRGILYTNDYGHVLTNDNGWTSLWDIPGGEDINPFRAFAKDIDYRQFLAWAENTENYVIKMPKPPQFEKITFAVDASWPGSCKEPFAISAFTQEGTLYDKKDSHTELRVYAHDHQDDVSEVLMSAPEITGEEWVAFSNMAYDLWHYEIINQTKAEAGEYRALIMAKSSNSEDLALYRYFTVVVTDSGPPPTSEGRAWGGEGNDYGNDVVADSSGNIYVCGSFYDEVDFDTTEATDFHESAGGSDAFISKFNPLGVFQWARTWGSESVDECKALTVDDSGNVYVTGKFSGTVDFDPSEELTDEHTSTGNTDAFLCKYDPSGKLIWARTWGGYDDATGQFYTAQNVGNGVGYDASGFILVTGLFVGTGVDMDPGEGVDIHDSSGNGDIFVSKFDTDGNFTWSRTWGGHAPPSPAPPNTNWHSDIGYDVAVDGYGNVWITGVFEGENIDFDPGPGVDPQTSWQTIYTQVPSLDIFLSKFDSAGNYIWSGVWGQEKDDDIGSGVAVDAVGDVYVSGRFFCGVDFKPGPGSDYHESSWYGYWHGSAFLSKFSNDCEFQWARTWGAKSSMDDVTAWDVTISDGNAYAVGTFDDTVDFYGDYGTYELTANGATDVFVSKFEPEGYFVDTVTFGGADDDYGYAIAPHTSDNLLITGCFYGATDLDPVGGDSYTSNGASDIFLNAFSESHFVPVNNPPVAIGFYLWDNHKVNQPVTFTAGFSYDPDGEIVKYEWDWENDGIYDEEGVNVVHTWTDPGIYYVNLKVTDNGGLTDDMSDDPIETEIKLPDPVAIAYADDYQPDTNQTVTFHGENSYDPDGGDIQLYEWDFDFDGEFQADVAGPDPTAEHQYPFAGDYYVNLRVTDDEGDTDDLWLPDELLLHINVLGGPVAKANADKTQVHIIEGITFDASESYDPDGGNIVQYEWDFDYDGFFVPDVVTDEPVVVRGYDEAGTYEVNLRVTDNDDLTDDLTDPGDTLIEIIVTPMQGAEAHLGSDVMLVTQGVGSSGGTLYGPAGSPIEGVEVDIPPDALDESTTISLGYNDGYIVPVWGQESGTIITLDAGDTEEFHQPVDITIPFDEDEAYPVPYYIDASGNFYPLHLLEVDDIGNTATFQTFHTSWFSWIFDFVTIEPPVDKYAVPGFTPAADGFQIENDTSVYDDGKCFGMSSFALWYYRNHSQLDGHLYPRFMYYVDEPLQITTGQHCIASRAHTAVSLQWQSWVDGIITPQDAFTDYGRYCIILNMMLNSGNPVLIYMRDTATDDAHAVLAYEFVIYDEIDICNIGLYDPNQPGQESWANYDYNAAKFNAYQNKYDLIYFLGHDTLFVRETYDNILDDAEHQFHGSSAVTINITSHENGQEVYDDNVFLEGTVESGEILADEITVLVDGVKYKKDLQQDGHFIADIVLDTGKNYLQFDVKGHNAQNQLKTLATNYDGKFFVLEREPYGLTNGSFETGDFYGWDTTWGDARVVTQLGTITPPDGDYMCLMSTGYFSGYDGANVFQYMGISPDATIISFKWNVVSEEFLEWQESHEQQDLSGVTVHYQSPWYGPYGAEIYPWWVTTNGIYNSPSWGCPWPVDLIFMPDFHLENGYDVYQSGWQTLERPLSEFAQYDLFPGMPILLELEIYDDSAPWGWGFGYDTVFLIDDIKIE